jgi:hypothetical protein
LQNPAKESYLPRFHGAYKKEGRQAMSGIPGSLDTFFETRW